MVFPNRDFHDCGASADGDWEMDLQFILFLVRSL
jgi:hypothetical protein